MDRKFILPKISLCIITASLLTGCSWAWWKPAPVITGPDVAVVKLSESASSVSNSYGDVAAIQRVTTAPIINRPLTAPNNYDLSGLVSIDWSGPVGPLVEKVGAMAGYQVRIVGEPPAIPVIVSITARDVPLMYLLRNADFQCASNCNIKVLTSYRLIELQYARS